MEKIKNKKNTHTLAVNSVSHATCGQSVLRVPL